MNPRSAWDFLRSKFGLFIVFIVVLFAGMWIYGQRQTTAKQATKLALPKGKTVDVGQVRLPLGKGLENGVPQQVLPRPSTDKDEPVTDGRLIPFRTPPPPPPPPPPPAAAPVSRPAETRPVEKKPVAAPPAKVRHVSLLASYVAPVAASAVDKRSPVRFIPFGTLLKCKLVNTVDTANIETPVIALLLEDVWQNGERVMPANTLVHGTARAGRIRDRINAAGTWRFVWQDGRELAFNGFALDREYEHEIDGYGITDGSAGIKGRLLATDDYQELKMLAAAALSGFARGTQDRTQSGLGVTIPGSVANGVREGIGEVFDLYAQRTLKEIEQNGHFVRVAAGKEFYVYVAESVNPDKAKIAGSTPEPADSRANPLSVATRDASKG